MAACSVLQCLVQFLALPEEFSRRGAGIAEKSMSWHQETFLSRVFPSVRHSDEYAPFPGAPCRGAVREPTTSP